MEPGKKIIIIGGGVGGLVTGIYARKAGFRSVIYEKNPASGGECTGWDRNGYHIDGCIHWLAGTGEGRDLNRVWKETGALENIDIYQPESLVTVFNESDSLSVWRDRDKLRRDLLAVAPEDEEEIEEMLQAVAIFQLFEPSVDKPRDTMSLMEKLRFLYRNRKVMRLIGKYSRITVSEYLSRFKNSLIRAAFNNIVPGEYSTHNLFFTLASFTGNNAGIPKGGSKAFSERLEKKYRELGGEIIFNTEVKEIIIDSNTATGILTREGSQFFGDYIVTACDTRLVFEKLLRGKFFEEEFLKRYEDSEAYPLQTSVYAAFGVDADLTAFPGNSVFKTAPVIFEDRVIDTLSMKHFCHEPSFSPEGKSLIAVYFNANYDWWKDLNKNPRLYRAEKARLAVNISTQLQKRFPEIMNKTSVLDVATPLTYERYCGAYRGSWLSFGNTPLSEPLRHDGRVKGVKNLYMTGQWLMPPGGLPAAAITGRWTIERIKNR